MVNGLLQVLSALFTCWDAMYFQTLFIAFCIAIAYCILGEDGISYSVILRYTPKTSKIGTSLFGSIKLLIALKDIWSAKLGSMPGISIVIIK